MKAKLRELLEIQRSLDTGNLVEALTDRPIYRAIWINSTKVLENYGWYWKWFNSNAKDLNQVKLSLVEIFQLGLSDKLAKENDLDVIAESLVDSFVHVKSNINLTTDTFVDAVEDYVLTVLRSKDFYMYGFFRMSLHVDLTLEDLYKLYIGKIVLDNVKAEFNKQTLDFKESELLACVSFNLSADSNFKEQFYTKIKQQFDSLSSV